MLLTEDQQLRYAQHLYKNQEYEESKKFFSKLSESLDDKVKREARSYLKKLKSKLNDDQLDETDENNEDNLEGEKLK
ncbi:40642_t:CDS:2 [Gigaspora margarita]|uniref:40642_t:CDS:1 n=1 Tax=Gigaspora margarita TaxID=4874 RepID=A0ABN7VM59_GIGMA|nr:40642_t:CDS:2 [Gigaspora margarita]